MRRSSQSATAGCCLLILLSVVASARQVNAWVVAPKVSDRAQSTKATTSSSSTSYRTHPNAAVRLEATAQRQSGNLHGQGACFLPLKQLPSDYYAPRIIQIAGAYPGLSRADYESVQSEPPADTGQWSYDFSDPDGPQLGTMALDGSNLVASCQDPVIIIASHRSIGVDLPKEVVDDVDLVLLVDRAKRAFGERKFLVLDSPSTGLVIAAYATKAELPDNAQILGQVELAQIPWLPCMQPSRTGFMEEDEYY
jgi:Rubisco Assembly chaperone C-terminal domain